MPAKETTLWNRANEKHLLFFTFRLSILIHAETLSLSPTLSAQPHNTSFLSSSRSSNTSRRRMNEEEEEE